MSRPVLLRPSNKSWPLCTASPWLLEANKDRILRDTSSADSDEGSVAHDRAERWLKEWALGLDPAPPANELRVYTDYVATQASLGKARLGTDLLIEQKMPLYYDAGYEGMVDAAIIDSGNLHIIDLKWGQGVDVTPEENSQTAIYWRSLYEQLELKGWLAEDALATVTIVQPRYRGDTPIKTWVCTVDEMLRFTDDLAKTAENVYAKRDLEFHPSPETCQFCPAFSWCAAANGDAADRELLKIVEEGVLPDLEVIDQEQMVDWYLNRAKVKSWLNKLEKYVWKNVTEGGDLSKDLGFAPGTRKGNTAWVDEDPKHVVRDLRKLFPHLKSSDLYEKKLMSPTKVINEVLDKDEAEEMTKKLTFRPEPKPVIVPKDDASGDDLLELLP